VVPTFLTIVNSLLAKLGKMETLQFSASVKTVTADKRLESKSVKISCAVWFREVSSYCCNYLVIFMMFSVSCFILYFVLLCNV